MAGDVGGESAEDAAGGAGAIDAAVGIGEIRVVEEVKALGTELHHFAFLDAECLKERHVHLGERRSEDLVAADGAELSALRTLPGPIDLAISGKRDGGGFEPALLAGVTDAVVTNEIGAAPTGIAAKEKIFL